MADALVAEADAASATNMVEFEQECQRVLEIDPHCIDALLALARIAMSRRDGWTARSRLLLCCSLAPYRAEAWDTLGLALMQTDELDQAEQAFAEAHRLAPGNADYALHRVECATARGTGDALLDALEAESADDALNVAPMLARGVLLERLSRRAEAIDALEAAAALAPDAPLPTSLLGGLLARSNRLREAEVALRRATALDPTNPRLPNDHATVLMRMHRHAEARTELMRVLDEHGELVHVMCNLVNATTCLGMQEEAVALAQRAIAAEPNTTLPRRALCNALPYCDGIGGAELLAALRDCSDRLPRTSPPVFSNRRDPDRRLVIGLLSGSLKTHPVGWLTVAGFETLDPDRFAIVCLAQRASRDPIARRFRAIASEWRDVDTLSDTAVATLARDLGIDMLIDLGGYGDAARMTACAHRLAPVQIKWVGMQNHSSGLAEMDWIITDRWETPPELAHLYSERLLRMPDGYICYSAPPYAPDVVALPALEKGRVTFGCFNNLAKVTPRTIATWCAVLQRVRDSRLILKTHQFADASTRERIVACFAAHGVAPERIELRGASPHRAFLREYNEIDIVLDPFPYSGGLTTCEALWMGVPTVTLPGESFASRHSLSHLSNAGLADWVAADTHDYVELAVRRAADLPGLADLREGLRARVRASPLCDEPRFGRNLGAALRQAWCEWCTV
jgi:protein O-GlcNAc transferase